MINSSNAARTGVIALVLTGTTAWAQAPKELQTKAGAPVVLVDLLNSRPDCSTTPGPVAVPIVSVAPTNGVIQMQIVVSNVAASAKCPARKIPSTALIYIPNKDFSGSDTVQIEIDVANQKRSFSYRITVQPTGQQL